MLVFGAVYTHAVGLAVQPYLKTVLNLLMSLGNDPHPVIHHWALHALGQVVSSSSLPYSPSIPNTLVRSSKSMECRVTNRREDYSEMTTLLGICRRTRCLSYHRRGDISTRTRASRDWAYEKLGPRSRLGLSFGGDDGVIVEAIHCIHA